MKNKKFMFGLGGLTLGAILLVVNGASAYRGDPSVLGPNYSADRHEAMTRAFLNNDYYAWKALMTNGGRVVSVINENNFSRFAEAHNLAKQGRLEEAKQIRSELGLGVGAKMGQKGMGWKNK